MLYQFRTKSEAMTLADRVPHDVLDQICDVAAIMDSCYNSHGMDGGYILLAENVHDVEDIKRIHLDYTTEPVELVKANACVASNDYELKSIGDYLTKYHSNEDSFVLYDSNYIKSLGMAIKNALAAGSKRLVVPDPDRLR